MTNHMHLNYVDFILVFIFSEWVFLCWRHSVKGVGLNCQDVTWGLLPGFFLILGIRFAVPLEVPVEVLLCLALSGIAHSVDFYRRSTSSTEITKVT